MCCILKSLFGTIQAQRRDDDDSKGTYSGIEALGKAGEDAEVFSRKRYDVTYLGEFEDDEMPHNNREYIDITLDRGKKSC